MPDPVDQPITLIDRDDIVRDSIKALLESHGFSVHEYRTPEGFLAAGVPAQCTCVILGLHGNVVDGLGLLQALGRRGLNVPVILISEGASVTMKAETSRAGAFAHIERPIQEAMLLQAIAAALTGHSAQPS